jgi:NADPH:quinone reductase-like Zn-dependent oxidoreductase
MIPGGEVVGRRADGARVAAIVTSGGYAEKALAHPAATFEVPDGVHDGQALALIHFLTRPHLLHASMAELLAMVERGELRTIVGGHYPLADASRAHEDLRSHGTVGKLVLDVRSSG